MTTVDTGTDDLLAETDDGVGVITLNRPDRRNAMTGEMLTALAAVLGDFEQNPLVGALLITGAGSAFCSGGDVKGFSERGGEGGQSSEVDPDRVRVQQDQQRATVGRIYGFSKPTVAALPGAAAGAGVGIALAADLRIGCPRTLFATAFVNVGLSGDYGSAWLLDRLVGPSRARELLFLGERIDAERSLSMGLVNSLVPADQLAAEALALAGRLANGPRQALAGMKENLLRAPERDLFSAMDAEVPLHMACGVADDHREALAAFTGKRVPVYPAPWR